LVFGYTSTLTGGVWVGFDQPTTIIPHGYGAALALPVWVQVMNKAAQHYPAEPLQPTMALQHTTVCSISSQLATTGCMAAGSAYDIDLPADKIPAAACQVARRQQCPLHSNRRAFRSNQRRSRAVSSDRSGDFLAAIMPVIPSCADGEGSQNRSIESTIKAVLRKRRTPNVQR